MPNSRQLIAGIAGITCWFWIQVSFAGSTPIYIGVLEGPQTDQAQPNPPLSSQVHVRVAFREEGSEWKPMDTDFGTPAALGDVSRHYPSSIYWTVVFHGKAIGRIRSHDPGVLHWYADIGTQVISTDKANVPVVRTGAEDFSYAGGTASMRPLLLVSVPDYRDPQRWASTALTHAEIAEAAAAFRERVPRSERCKAEEEGPIRMVPYGDDKIHVIKAYRDIDGEVLFGERLEDPQANCEFFDDDNFFDYWFAMDKHGHVRYLDSQMTPMEAADVDNSGKSAWIFFTSRGEDEDGYELFYDDFNKVASFHWTYH